MRRSIVSFVEPSAKASRARARRLLIVEKNFTAFRSTDFDRVFFMMIGGA